MQTSKHTPECTLSISMLNQALLTIVTDWTKLILSPSLEATSVDFLQAVAVVGIKISLSG